MSVTSTNQESQDLKEIRESIDRLIKEYTDSMNKALEEFKSNIERIKLNHQRDIEEAIRRLEELAKGVGGE